MTTANVTPEILDQIDVLDLIEAKIELLSEYKLEYPATTSRRPWQPCARKSTTSSGCATSSPTDPIPSTVGEPGTVPPPALKEKNP